jgi:hypothetical protein
MFPHMKQRLLIAVATLVAGMAWLAVAQPLRAADGSSGIALVSSQSGVFLAVALMTLVVIPVLGLGLVASAGANPLSGLFVWGAALSFLAVYGGDAGGWLRRYDANVPSDFWYLIPEVIAWHLGVGAMIVLVHRYRDRLRERWPGLITKMHLGKDISMNWPDLAAWRAGLLCIVVGGVLCHLDNRTFGTSQVMLSLALAFGIAAFNAHFFFPQKNPVIILLAPLVVAVVGYAWVALGHSSESDFLAAMYSQRLTGLGQALPIHYASAGIVGCAMGLGAAQGFRYDPKVEAAAAAKDEEGSGSGDESQKPDHKPDAKLD